MQGTVTDAAAMQAAGLEAPFVGDSLDAYQAFTDSTAHYPRVYTEDQVRNMLKRFYGRYNDDWPEKFKDEFFLDDIERHLAEFETPFTRLVYPVLGLLGEAGEIANKLKKVARDDQGQMDLDKSEEIAAETGDVFWYLARVTTELGGKLSAVAQANVLKLFSRKQRGVLGGSGDNR